MLVYVILIFLIIIGQLLVDGKVIKKKSYCWFIGILFILLCGLRSIDLGMWDTASVYIPSFNIINSNSIVDLMGMYDTQYKFIGYVLYSKFIGLISESSNFYIFMMGWPFYVALTHIINKYAKRPVYSFLAVLAMGYFTYSFSMMRGMLAFAAICMALDSALENKWKKMVFWTLIGSTFHITSLLFLGSFFVKKITWTVAKILSVFIILIALSGVIPSIWQSFVSDYIKWILPTYNYYGYIGGVIATGMIVVYAVILIIALLKVVISKEKSNLPSFNDRNLKFVIHKSKRHNKADLIFDENTNFLVGLSVLAVLLMTLTYVLSEMMRISMIFGIASVLLVGMGRLNVSNKNMTVVTIFEWMEAVMLIIYFVVAALPNMNSVPYMFFWE